MIANQYDAIIAYDSFFHLEIEDQIKMLERFSSWLKETGLLLLSTGSEKGEVIDSMMHGVLFSYYSMSKEDYIKYFQSNEFKILLQEEDQPSHLTWIVQKIGE